MHGLAVAGVRDIDTGWTRGGPRLRGADGHPGRGAHLGQHLLRHALRARHALGPELAALGHVHPLVRRGRLLEVALLLALLEVTLLLLLLQVDRAVPLLVLLLHLLLGAYSLRHLLRSHALLLLLHHHALLGLALVRHALHLHLRLALGLLARHHLGSSLGPALSPRALTPLLVLLLLLRSLLDERGHQARVAFQDAEDLLVLLLGLRALEGLDQLLEGELHGGPHPALPGLPLSLGAHGPLLLLHSRRHLEPGPLLLLLLLLSPLVLLGPAHHGHLLH